MANYDVIDLISGLGIGLCFSSYWKIGVLLIGLMILIALVKSSEKKEKKKKQKK